MNEKGAIPMIDIAYQGFGDGLDEDAAATRAVASSCPETLIAASCSKNFGIYRERTGLLMAVAQDKSMQAVAQGNLAYLNRQNFSFPPDHGARLVSIVLNDDALRADWQAELEEVRNGMLVLRKQFAGELQKLSGSDRFGFLAQHRGMFSRLGAAPDKLRSCSADHGITWSGIHASTLRVSTRRLCLFLAKAVIDVGI